MSTPPLSPDEMPATPEARAAYIKAAQDARQYGPLEALFRAELLASAAFAEAMAPYDPEQVEMFTRNYVNQKVAIYLRGPRALEAQEARFLKYRESAAEVLWEIQQKKLFDLQCRWRAEEITLPGVRHHWDFIMWSEYIEYCPWLPPITAEEVGLYATYLRSDMYRHERNGLWQDYESIKLAADPGAEEDEDEGEDSESPLPGWYAFHNKYTDAGKLLQLFDLRGTKEEHYMKYYRAEREQQIRAAQAEEAATGPKPRLPFCGSLRDVAPFLDRFEDPDEVTRLQRWRQAALEEQERDSWQLEKADYWYTCFLKADDVDWPLVYHDDWRLAVRDTGIDYWRHQVADILLDVWQEMEQHRAMGLPVSSEGEYSIRKPFPPLPWPDDDWYSQALLRGRELAGEPRDFNF